MHTKALSLYAAVSLLVSCHSVPDSPNIKAGHAMFFELTDSCLVVVSPSDGHRDSVDVSSPFSRIVCMSSTHTACLSALGHQQDIVGVNGLRYISDPVLRCSDAVTDVGDLDFERVISIKPDILIASGDGINDYSRLESFGIPVIHLYDYMEQHPLARAEYIRIFGALTGCREAADSIFNDVCDRYQREAELASSVHTRPRVLVNVPYKESWYVPGRDSYFARLIHDAGAEIAGAHGGAGSGVMTVENAYGLSREASFWIHTGWCRSLDELRAMNPLFASFRPLCDGKVYNNILRASGAGGNDYYESGAVRPDLVLADLIRIFHPELSPEMKNVSPGDLHYYIELH